MRATGTGPPPAFRRSPRASAATSAVLGLLVLAACTDDPGRREPVASPESSTSARPDRGSAARPHSGSTTDGVPPSATAPSPGCDGPEVVRVVDEGSLHRALEDAVAGQVIQLAEGRYEGNFVASADARPEEPIVLCGTRGAVLDGGQVDGDYTLHLSGASFWHLAGFTVTGGRKGVMVDGGTGVRIEALMVTSMGDEAVHLRSNSTDNVVVGNTIRDTGLRKPKFGEGIYVGSAESNWCQLTGCGPDRSDRNVVEGNDIARTTAEAVDIKEGTRDGVVRGNLFDGSAMVEADSWVDVKGNGWTVEGNSGISTPADGFQVHEVVDGWGRDTVFSGNTVHDVPGYAVNVAGPRAIRDSTTVVCGAGDGGRAGWTNVECTDP